MRDGKVNEEADWCARRDGGRNLDGGGAGCGGGGEYVSDIFVESAAVEGGGGEAGGCRKDAGAKGEA